jgi:hypothetical protein
MVAVLRRHYSSSIANIKRCSRAATHYVCPFVRPTDHTAQPARFVSTKVDAAAEALGVAAEALGVGH